MTAYVGSNKIKDVNTHGVYVGSQNTNVITSVPKNIKLELTYGAWTQPIFSSNTNGSLTLSASHESQPAWYAFNGDKTTNDNCWWTAHGVTSTSNPCWIQLKSQIKLKLSQVVIRNEHQTPENFKTAYLQVSNNGSSWTNVATISGTNTGGYEITVNFTVNDGYYYYRLYFTESYSTGGVSIQTLTFSGTAQNTLTLKAGSKVYVPNGKNADGSLKFDEVVVANDISGLGWTTLQGMFFVSPSKKEIVFTGNTQIASGSSHTLSGGNVWYDTTTNLVKRCDDNSTWTSGYSLPICIATSNGSSSTGSAGITSIDQIFDWCGFIGSTAFVLPGVKGLIPNGFKTDGTYNVIEYTVPSVATVTGATTLAAGTVNLYIFPTGLAYWLSTDDFIQETLPTGEYSHVYIPSKNEYWWKHTGDYSKAYDCACGQITIADGGKITSLTPATVQPSTTTIPINAIYNGSQLVYQYRPYVDGTVLLYGSNTGLKTYTLEKGLYQCCVVAGGFRSGYWSSSSGSAVEIQFRLTETSTVQVYSGGTETTAYLNINGTRMITAYGDGGQTGAPTVSAINTSVYWVKTVVNNRGLGGGGHKGSVSPYENWGAGQHAGGARLAYVGV